MIRPPSEHERLLDFVVLRTQEMRRQPGTVVANPANLVWLREHWPYATPPSVADEVVFMVEYQRCRDGMRTQGVGACGLI